MMKYLHFFLVAALAFYSCSQNKSQSSSETQSETTPDTGKQDFYKRLEGTIAGQPVVMHLHKTGNSYNGIYYYTSVGQWLTLSVDSISADSIYFSEYTQGDGWRTQEVKSATLHCRLNKETLKGTWVSGDHKKTYAVELRENYPEGSYRFGMKNYSDSMIAFKNKKDSPFAEVSCAFAVAADNEWINERIKTVLTFDSSAGFDEGFIKYSTKYLADYSNNLPAPDDTTIPLSTYNYASSQSVYVRYNDNDLVVLESDYYDYSGGAHGNYGSTFYCYDIAQKKQLALRDIVTADTATLQPIVEKYFRIQYHIKDTSLSGVLFEEHLALNDNFYLTEKGIGFLYNPYEVASYAQGQINVFVPFTAVQQYLTAYIRERLKIK